MFEAVFADSNDSNANRKQKQLQRLLVKYIELKRFQEINQQRIIKGHLPSNKRNYNKRKVLRRIRNELNKRLKPEETYEVWHEFGNSNTNLRKFESKSNNDDEYFNDMQTEDEVLERDENNEDSVEEMLNLKAEEQLEKFTNTFDGSSTWVKANFFIQTRGLEILPIYSNDIGTQKLHSTMKSHVENLNILLHLNLLRENWDLSYKLFCILIRIPIVDIRSIWSIGIEILYNIGKERDSSSFLIKNERFFEWLSSLLMVNDTGVNTSTKRSRNISAPIWRSGSKTHTPLYIITSLWNLLTKRDITKLKDRLENLLLEPPFNTDGVFYYLTALCVLTECVASANEIKMKTTKSKPHVAEVESESSKLIENLKVMTSYLEKCDELEFNYPTNVFTVQIASLKKYASNFQVENASDTEALMIETDYKKRIYPIDIGHMSSEENSSDGSDYERSSIKIPKSKAENVNELDPSPEQSMALEFEID